MADRSGGRRLHVAIVIPGFVVGRDDPGLPAVVDLIERIGRRHDCEVIALRHPSRRPAYRVAGVTVRALGAGGAGGLRGRVSVLAGGIGTVVRRHRRRPIDLVHGLWADEAGAVATIGGRLIRRPVVVSVLGGELVGLPEIGYGAALGRGGRWAVALSMRGADLVTAGSSTTLEMLRHRRRSAPTAVVPLGVDTTVFRPGPKAPGGPTAPAGPAPQTVLFAGSLEPVKDPGAMLRVFARLAADRPGLQLELAGDGRLRPSLETAVATAGLGGRVRFAGHLGRPALAERYRAATVLAITSRHEGESMVAVEAAASGLPVVGTRVGIVPDLGAAATSVAIGDETALAAAIAAVLDDPGLAARMGAAGRAAAIARFDIERTAADLLERYDALVSSDEERARPS
jgi:glycosyltransferase involved in cell wall biosynthesis